MLPKPTHLQNPDCVSKVSRVLLCPPMPGLVLPHERFPCRAISVRLQAFLLGVQTSCSSTNFEKSPGPTNSAAYFTTGFRYVGIRKIMTFLGLPQTFVSAVFVGVFSPAIVVC